ncbi:MAG: alpha/beta hydrolase [Pseudomonadota bacterium]
MNLPLSGDGFIEAGGLQLEYQCFGPPQSASLTLVLLHEGLGCVAMWRDFPARLAQHTGGGVLVYSRAGYGGSDEALLPRPTHYMHEEATEVLPVVLQKLGIKKCLLIGHSDGATIAAIHIGSQNEFIVRGAVLIAPHFFAEDISIAAIKQAKQSYETGDLRARLARYHKAVDCAFYGWNDVWLSADFKHWNVSDVIDYFRVPVLGIQGREDQYGTLAQLTEIEQRSYAPFESLIIEHCGHSPHIEQPQQTLDAIVDFNRRLMAMESLA